MGHRIDLVEFIGDILDEVPNLTDDEREVIKSRLQIADTSRAPDLQNLLLDVNDDD